MPNLECPYFVGFEQNLEAKFDRTGLSNFAKFNSQSSQTYLSNTVMPNLK